MDESYVGQQVVGLDLHRRRTVMVRMTEAGERLEAVRFVSDPAVLAKQIAKAGRRRGSSWRPHTPGCDVRVHE